MRQPLSRTSAALGTAALIALLVLVPVRAQGTKDIVDVAVVAGSFKTLVAAVQAANLVDVLKRPGPLTVLAPTDEAFAKIPKARRPRSSWMIGKARWRQAWCPKTMLAHISSIGGAAS